MVPFGLAFGAALAVVAGSTFAIVGRVISKRRLTGDEAFANTAFVVWWYALAGLSIARAGINGAAALGILGLSVHVTILHLSLLVLCVGLWGLGYYLAYLFTGRPWWHWIFVGLYSAYYVLLVYLVAWAQPIGVEIHNYGAQLAYLNDLESLGTWLSIFGILLIGPQFLGAVAYASLLLRVKGAFPRYRIGLVSATFVAWFGSSLVANVSGLNEHDWWPPISQSISVVAALLVLLAFKPPGFIQRWLEDRDRAPLREGE